jgi:predicted dehydrogenase
MDARKHGNEDCRDYTDFRRVLDDKSVDAIVVATPDREHVAPAVEALHAGYAVLVEKPVAVDATGLERVYSAVGSAAVLHVAHVLRSTAFFQTVHEIISSGRLGTVVNASHRENVAFWHMAHSYVRGNWRREATSSPLLLAKACHDLDILHWNLGPMRRLQSFGALTYFTSSNAPTGATERCTDECPAADTCPFDARRFYLGDYTGWPVSTISDDLSIEARRRALHTGPYGRCVFRSDNDVVDHQVVSMETTSGATATLTVHGHGHEDARTFRYDGSRGTLRGVFGMVSSSLEIHDHLTGERETIDVPIRPGGHGGGDEGAIDEFLRAVEGDPAAPRVIDVRESHYLAFAAEASRRSGDVVTLGQA